MEMALKHALANAYKYGKASAKPVMSKVLAENPEAKENAKELLKEIKKAVAEVNRLTPKEIESRLREIAPEMLVREKREETKELPPLKNAQYGKVHLRLPPEPNGYLHVGHAMSFYLNYLYAKRYGGKLVLKFEDTNPLNEKREFYEEIENDLKWLGIKWDGTFYLSEHFQELELGAKKIIENGLAYVSTSSAEDIKKWRMELHPDPSRKNSVEDNLKLWKEMKKGERHILRWKGDPKDKNSVLRDPTLYRVIDMNHPWTGKNHVVYPTYDFASAFTDGLLGITHVLRSEEFLMRAPLHKSIIKASGWKPPFYIHFGRFELEGVPTSKRKIRPLVEKGLVAWDDPRLATLKGLRRRGIVPKTFEDLVMATGPHRGKSMVSWSLLTGLNRKNIDPVAGRFFAVMNPIELKLEGKSMFAEVPMNPNNPGMGSRKIRLTGKVFIEKADYRDGGRLRLKGAYNVNFDGKRAVYDGDEIIRPIVQWVSDPVEAKVIVSGRLFDGDRVHGLDKRKALVEKGIEKFKGDIVQLERIGFARIDSRKPLRIVLV